MRNRLRKQRATSEHFTGTPPCCGEGPAPNRKGASLTLLWEGLSPQELRSQHGRRSLPSGPGSGHMRQERAVAVGRHSWLWKNTPSAGVNEATSDLSAIMTAAIEGAPGLQALSQDQNVRTLAFRSKYIHPRHLRSTNKAAAEKCESINSEVRGRSSFVSA